MTASTVDVSRVLISAEKLRHKIEVGRDVVVLEVLRAPGGESQVLGAHAVALETDLVGERSAGSGNLPLPSDQQIQDAVRRWGINSDSIVVPYSPENAALAARAWWTRQHLERLGLPSL